MALVALALVAASEAAAEAVAAPAVLAVVAVLVATLGQMFVTIANVNFAILTTNPTPSNATLTPPKTDNANCVICVKIASACPTPSNGTNENLAVAQETLDFHASLRPTPTPSNKHLSVALSQESLVVHTRHPSLHPTPTNENLTV